ncbi:MAG: dienelactone hydrolase family protein [Bacteriovoracia bacterium]
MLRAIAIAPFTLIFALLFPATAPAAIKTQNVEYKIGDTVFEGYLAVDSVGPKKKPGVLVVHAWKGLDANAKERADMLAKLGYVAFAADIYGKGIRPQDPKDAAALSGSFKNDRAKLRIHVNAALEELKKQKGVDASHLAAIGYCFGGTTVLELARSGADVKGVVSFHGGLGTPKPEDAKNVKAKVLALHGADDPFVKDEEVKAFEDEMRAGKVDWQLVKYSGAVHSFTHKDAGNDPSKGQAYHADADRRSWQAMRDFFKEILGK